MGDFAGVSLRKPKNHPQLLGRIFKELEEQQKEEENSSLPMISCFQLAILVGKKLNSRKVHALSTFISNSTGTQIHHPQPGPASGSTSLFSY